MRRDLNEREMNQKRGKMTKNTENDKKSGKKHSKLRKNYEKYWENGARVGRGRGQEAVVAAGEGRR